MIVEILSRLFRKKSAEKHNSADDKKELSSPLGGGYYLVFKEVNNGEGGYCRTDMYLRKIGDDAFRHCIIDERGIIRNFPGFKDGEWKKLLEYPLDNKVRFDFGVSIFKNGKALISWTLQPDGRYFEDEDGYGAENYEEVTLYSYLNEDGMFTEPFYYKE